MDEDKDQSTLVRIYERLAVLAEKVNSLHEHKAGAAELNRLDQEIRTGDFRTLQEISGAMSNLRSDIKEWTGNAINASETRIMGAIKANQSWQRNIPVYIALALAVIALLTGNTHLLRLLGGV